MDVRESQWPVIPNAEVHQFIVRCMTAQGIVPEHSAILADVLLAGDYRGHYSHGLNRLGMYVKDVQFGKIDKNGRPKILKEKGVTAWVDGDNYVGPVVGKFCMELAIEKAKQHGVGWVVAKGSNHFGIAGWYSMMASEQGLINLEKLPTVMPGRDLMSYIIQAKYAGTTSQINAAGKSNILCNPTPVSACGLDRLIIGMAMTNSTACAVPTRAKKVAVGSNPIAVGAPASNGDSFLLDMATCTVAHGKVEIARIKNEMIPEGCNWGCDDQGQVTQDPKKVMNGGGLLPLGGTEKNGSYKGYGLAMMVEVFCGLLAGSNYGTYVPHLLKYEGSPKPNLGQCFIAVDPSAFAPGFEDRMSDLNSICRNLPPVDENKNVLIPGEPEKANMKKCDDLGGIPYHPNVIQVCNDIAKELGVAPLKLY